MTSRRLRLMRQKELRDKCVTDQIRIGLRLQLRSLRDARGITQQELAERIGTTQSAISRMERNPSVIGLATYLKIAQELDVAFVARFEAIDTYVEWIDNPSVKKMTPRASTEILTPENCATAADEEKVMR